MNTTLTVGAALASITTLIAIVVFIKPTLLGTIGLVSIVTLPVLIA